MRPVVTFLTDFGTQDPFVGIMKGVVLGICPDASLVDLCHEIPAHDVLGRQFSPAHGSRIFPCRDHPCGRGGPGGRRERRPILADIDGQFFVGPDNGVLSYPLASAGRYEVRQLSVETFWRHPVSASFHGRDIFAPVAGHLAAGVEPARFGPIVADPVRLETPRPRADATGRVQGQVIRVDRFGNCLTNIPGHLVAGVSSERGGQVVVSVGGRHLGRFVRTFADVAVGKAGAFVGSADYVELFSNQGHLAREWRIGPGDFVTLERTTET